MTMNDETTECSNASLSCQGGDTSAATQPTGALSAASMDAPVAAMGGLSLRVKDLVLMLSGMPEEDRLSIVESDDALQAATCEELMHLALVDLAKQVGFDKRPEVVHHARRAAERAVAELYLAAQAAPGPDFPSEALMRSAYEQEKDVYATPERINLGQIFIAAPGRHDKETSQQRAELHNAAQRLALDLQENRIEFSQAARRHSNHKETAESGGEIGWTPIDNVVPEVAKAVRNLGADDISGVIETPPGFHIVKVLGRVPAKPIPFDRARRALAHRLRRRRAEESREAILRRLATETPPETDAGALKRVSEFFRHSADLSMTTRSTGARPAD